MLLLRPRFGKKENRCGAVEELRYPISSLGANRSRESAPDDRLREAIKTAETIWIASSLVLLAMTTKNFA